MAVRVQSNCLQHLLDISLCRNRTNCDVVLVTGVEMSRAFVLMLFRETGSLQSLTHSGLFLFNPCSPNEQIKSTVKD